jgi:translation initiation factor IF-2
MLILHCREVSLATRVFELARELGVTSKTMLEKCRAEGLDVKNHMATLSAGLEATLREWFSPDVTQTAVETAEHVDLEEARAVARKSRRHGEHAQAAEAPPAEAQVEPAEVPGAEPQPVEVAEVEPAGPVAPAAAVAAALAEQAQPQLAGPPASIDAGSQTAQPAQVVAEQAEAAEQTPPKADQEQAEPPKPEIKPAGPQVVPRPAKLQGPRIVRVEAAEHLDRPRRRQSPTQMGVGPRIVGAGVPGVPIPASAGRGPTTTKDKDTDDEKKKGKRRSPRRRAGTGRSAEGVGADGLQEWRERDLQERSARLAAAAGGGLRRHRASVARKGAGQVRPTVKVGKVEIDEPISVKSLSAATGLKAAEIIRKLMEMGTMVTANQNITIEMAEVAVADYDIELDIRRERTAEMEVAEQIEARPAGEMVTRAPVVTFLGHVDHGKTSLLDRIRNTAVAGGEAGGITQHLGSYRYDVGDKHVVFLDTPGHEAFTAMRARGANMTDVVVLVVAADDGVMPQTAEAINHAKAAKVPIVVALNKVDLPNANIQRAMAQLADRDLNPRQWGGNVEVIQTSATTGKGIEDLVEVLSLEAELLELKAEIGAPASGFVIESEIDPARGAIARLLVRNGTLKVGDIILAGPSHGRVRQIIDDKGKDIPSAGPSTPVEVAGMDGVAEAGDKFYVVADLDQARTAADDRRQRTRTRQLAAGPKATLESLLSKIEQGQTSEVPLIIKADVQGSIEALTGSLEKLSTAEAKVNILHAGVGGITTGDVALAEASGALIIGFNVVPDSSARQLAEEKGVDIRIYRVIYDIIDDVHKALEEGLTPEIREETLGRAEIRQVFKVSRVGTIAGCHVLDGMVNRNARVRVIRNNIVVIDERTLESLKRFKDDVREVRSGMECGLKIAGFDDVKEGDMLEFYKTVEVARSL